MPLAIRLLKPALKAVSAEIGIGAATPDQAPPYVAIAAFTFESVQAFSQAVMLTTSRCKAISPITPILSRWFR
jgi:hypothetical protein